MNRILTALLSIAFRRKSVVLFDELENGLYYSHYEQLWAALMTFAERYEGQIFLTTHSAEWLKALVKVAETKFDNIAVWRFERDNQTGRPLVRQFGGETFAAGLESGAEVR